MPALAALSAPIEKRSLNNAAADQLRQVIVTGAVAPGVRLTEVALAVRMNLSRGTIRAALQRLVTEGLVVQRPYAGWEVAESDLARRMGAVHITWRFRGARR